MNLTIVLLTLLSALPLLTTDIYIPAFPSIATDLHVAAWQVQSTLSLYLLGLSFSQLLYGPLGDRFGRRPLLLGGLALYAVSSLGCSLAPGILVLQICRLGQAIGACAGLVLARAIVVDLYDRKESARVFSLIYPIVGLSPIVAPVVGGLMNRYIGWRAVFVVLMGLAVLIWLGVFFVLKESSRDRTQAGVGQIARDLRSLLGEKTFLAYAGTIVFAYAAYFAYLSQAPFAFAKLSAGTQLDVFLYAPTAASYILGTMIGRRILARSNLDRVVYTGCVTFVVGALIFVGFALFGVSAPWQLFLPMCVVTAGNGMILSFSMAGALAVSPAIAATASGLVGSLQLGGASLASSLLGSALPATIPTLSVFVLIATGAALVLFRSHQIRQQSALVKAAI